MAVKCSGTWQFFLYFYRPNPSPVSIEICSTTHALYPSAFAPTTAGHSSDVNHSLHMSLRNTTHLNIFSYSSMKKSWAEIRYRWRQTRNRAWYYCQTSQTRETRGVACLAWAEKTPPIVTVLRGPDRHFSHSHLSILSKNMFLSIGNPSFNYDRRVPYFLSISKPVLTTAVTIDNILISHYSKHNLLKNR